MVRVSLVRVGLVRVGYGHAPSKTYAEDSAAIASVIFAKMSSAKGTAAPGGRTEIS